jgi:enamine deaminase RidA (YjgF/YER057c/UK114 family)
MIERTWSSLDGRDLFSVSVSGQAEGAVEDETDRAIATAMAEIEAAGFSPDHLVRSRLFARDREARSRASDRRRVLLVGARRASSSSFCDAERLAVDARMSIDLVAMRPRDGDAKIVREYEPAIAPPMFVTLDGLVFLSGVTDTTPGLPAQILAIRRSIGASLEEAGARLSAARLVSVFLAKEEDPGHALRLIDEAFGPMACPLTLSSVDGYSAPEKRVEIEVTAATV